MRKAASGSVHSLTPKEIIDKKGQKTTKPARLPGEKNYRPPKGPTVPDRDKIFTDSPVFGKSDPFRDF